MRVIGALDGTRYEVELTSSGVAGSKSVARLVEGRTGQKVMAGPTGPLVTVTPGDPRSVLALLSSRSVVESVETDDPGDRPRAIGRVY